MLKGPGKRQRAAAEDEEDHRLSRGDDFLEELFLPARQAQKCARGRFAGHLRPIFPERQDGNVGLLGRFNGFLQLRVGTTEEFRSFGVMNVLSSDFCSERCA